MSIIDELITDRIPGAAYGWTDMNRVADAMEYLAVRLCANGLDVVVSPQRFTREDFPTPAVFQHYLAQLGRIRQALSLWPTTPPVPTVDRQKDYMTVQEANDIERILLAVDRTLDQMARSFVRCGSAGLYSGQAGLPTEEAYAPHTWAELDAQGWTWADWDQKNWIQLNYWR